MLGRWYGPLSDSKQGSSIRNKIYASLANKQSITAFKVSRDIVHQAPDFAFQGEVQVFEPDSLERVEKIRIIGNEKELAEYQSPKIFFNVPRGECYWLSSDVPEFGLPVYRFAKGEIYVLAGYMKLNARKNSKVVGDFVPTPFITSYEFVSTESRAEGTLTPYPFPEVVEEDKVLWRTGTEVITLGRTDDETVTTPSGSYRIDFHPAVGDTRYTDLSGIAIYYPLKKLTEIDSLNDGPFEISQDTNKWEKVIGKKFNKQGLDPSVFITADGDSTVVNGYDLESGDKTLVPIEGRVKTRFGKTPSLWNVITPILIGSVAVAGGARLTNDKVERNEPKGSSGSSNNKDNASRLNNDGLTVGRRKRFLY